MQSVRKRRLLIRRTIKFLTLRRMQSGNSGIIGGWAYLFSGRYGRHGRGVQRSRAQKNAMAAVDDTDEEY